MRHSSRGTTIVELIIVIGIITIIAGVGFFMLVERRSRNDLTNSVVQIAALLREAQGRAVTQAEDASLWGVRFEHATTSRPFFALFHSAYGSTTRTNFQALPLTIGYVTSSIAEGRFAETTFTAVSGLRSGSSSISLYLKSNPVVSSTVTVSTSGVVSY